jgi:hypothetical protein
MFENRVLRNLCAPKRVEVTGDWRRVYVEELHGLYSSPLYDQIKEKERGGERRTYGKKRKARRSVVGKPEGKRPSGRPRHIQDNKEMNRKSVERTWNRLIWFKGETSGRLV